MKRHTLVLITGFCIFTSAGCDSSEKQKSQAEREKTSQGTQVNAGNYTPVPLDLSMGTPASPTPKPEDHH